MERVAWALRSGERRGEGKGREKERGVGNEGGEGEQGRVWR